MSTSVVRGCLEDVLSQVVGTDGVDVYAMMNGKILDFRSTLRFCGITAWLHGPHFWLLQTIRAWIAVMRENGVYTKTNECTWTSTHEVPDQVVTDETGERVNRTKALGAKIIMVGDDNAELNNRLHNAWQAFYKHKYILCHKNTNVKKRLLLMERIITPGVFWGVRGLGI